VKTTELSGSFEHERVVRCIDDDTGLRSIVAIHSTTLGPSLGGTRFFPFASEEDALADVLKLSRAMSYKSAAAGLSFGGGKAVIIGDPRRDRSDAVIRAYARFVDSLDGSYITTEDVGTTEADMIIIREETSFVTGLPTSHGGSGDPSSATAWGVFNAMRALARRLWDQDSLEGRHIAVQGVGKVGTYLVGHLVRAGSLVTVADVSKEAVERARVDHAVSAVGTDEIHSVRCDIFSPCALGGSLNADTIPMLRCEAVAGCANNQLASADDASRLAKREIVYAPDFIVNAGGVINISYEVGRPYDRDAALEHVARVGETLLRVLDLAETDGITTAAAAERLALERINAR
jgi:glutamate dehydrogenase/leucine dehydrogenase